MTAPRASRLATIDDAVLSDDRDTIVAGVELGLTVFTADPVSWAEGAAARALEAFLAVAQLPEPAWMTTSRLTDWHPVRHHELRQLVEFIAVPWVNHGPRHNFRFRLVDRVDAPSVSFAYREIDPRRTARAGVLELSLPQESDPRALSDLALRIADVAPFWSAVGGYAARWNESHQRTAFDAIHARARRYLGLDVHDAEESAWQAPQGLVSTGWLTFVGRALASRLELDLAQLVAHPWEHGTVVEPLRHGVLFRAGEAPTFGDLNQLAYPQAYAEVARVLAPYLVPLEREYPGTFADEGDTVNWQRRFVAPEGWR